MTNPTKNLVYPLSEEKFFSSYWLKKPYLSLDENHRIEDIKKLVSLDEVEKLITSVDSQSSGWLEVVKPTHTVDKRQYTNSNAFIDLAAVMQAYAEGYTVILTKMQKRLQSIATLCRQYEKFFLLHDVMMSSQVRSLLILTPANSVGIPVHYDDYGVFVLQVSGEKQWYIHDKIDPWPITEGPVKLKEEEKEKLPLLHKFIIKPGNWCYIPRGYYHNAETLGSHSLHIAIIVKSSINLDLLSEILKKIPELRASLPIKNFMSDPFTIYKNKLSEQFSNINLAQLIRTSLNDLHTKQVRDMDIVPDQSFRSINLLDEVSLDTSLRPRKGLYLEVTENRLACSGLSSYTISEKYTSSAKFLCQTTEFKVSELPGGLSNVERIQFVKQLIIDGLLIVNKTTH